MELKNRKIFILTSFLAATAVAIGAFGAHGLEGKISASSLASYKTGVFYHFIHALASLFSLLLFQLIPNKNFRHAALLFLAGIFCFSGSIYLLTTRELTGIGFVKILGPTTPLGGLLFIFAWCKLILGFVKIK